MKKLILILLGFLILAQLAVPYHMIRDRENTLRNGELFRFRTRPIDPADPFQGRYVWLGYAEDYISCPEDEMPYSIYGKPVYVTLATAPDGFAELRDWSREEPAEGAYIKATCNGRRRIRNDETDKWEHVGMRIHLPFDRFYMEETKAPRAEQLVRDGTRNTNCWAEVRVLNGKAVIEDVYVSGRPLRELVTEEQD